MNNWQQIVLGIDAAWTSKQPTGVSLLGFDESGWHSIAVAPGYRQFTDLLPGKTIDWQQLPEGGEPAIALLLDAASGLSDGVPVDVIAVDMPLSREKITGRRVADNELSREFGSRGCAVHSPSSVRPGNISDNLRSDCEIAGFHLATNTSTAIRSSLIEVYPHTAILELLNLDYRHPYKVSKSGKYWKGTSVAERKVLLIQSLQSILDELEKEISNINIVLPEAVDVPSLNYLKRYEDAIDALVCSWTAIRFLRGECKAYGDESAAIWSPVKNGTTNEL